MSTKMILLLAAVGAVGVWAYTSGSSSGKYSGVAALRMGVANGATAVGLTSVANAIAPGCCAGCAGGSQQPGSAGPAVNNAQVTTLQPLNPGAATGTTAAQPVIGGVLPVNCGGCA